MKPPSNIAWLALTGPQARHATGAGGALEAVQLGPGDAATMLALADLTHPVRIVSRCAHRTPAWIDPLCTP